MYELISVTDRTYYIESPSKVGLYRTDEKHVIAVDSGNSRDAAKRIRRILDAQGWELTAVFTTHCHADHIGGCHYLQEQTGCAVYANGIDTAFTQFPILEPAYIYGACPPKDLRHKFLLAEGCTVTPPENASLPDGFTAIPLPGHSFSMVGYRTADDVVFLADCLSSRETLDKYGLTFLHDVGKYLETLEAVKTMQAKLFVPAHAAATVDIAPLAQYNIDKTTEAISLILSLCRESITFDELLKKVFDTYGLTLNFEQYALVGSTLRSYLAYLRDTERLTVEFADNRMMWKTVN